MKVGPEGPGKSVVRSGSPDGTCNVRETEVVLRLPPPESFPTGFV